MTREEVIERLRPHEAELRQAGVEALYLFGSTARNQASRTSDVDLACDIDDSRNLSLLDFIEVQQEIGRLLRRRRVDLVERKCLRPRVKTLVEQDMVRVF